MRHCDQGHPPVKSGEDCVPCIDEGLALGTWRPVGNFVTLATPHSSFKDQLAMRGDLPVGGTFKDRL